MDRRSNRRSAAAERRLSFRFCFYREMYAVARAERTNVMSFGLPADRKPSARDNSGVAAHRAHLIHERLAEVTGFQWDTGNLEKNWIRHAVSVAECEQLFFNEPLVVASDAANRAGRFRNEAAALVVTDRFDVHAGRICEARKRFQISL